MGAAPIYVAAAPNQISILALESNLYGDLGISQPFPMGVGFEMAPLIKEFIAKLTFNFKLEHEIALLPSSATTSIVD